MPLTFPSHAAAILPLLHLPGARGLSVSALVIGTTTPDLVYLGTSLGAAAHRPAGLLLYCLPLGLVAFVVVEALVLPVVGPLLVALGPRRIRPQARRLLGPRPLPRGLRAWLALALALLLGAATHQLWDGFTHAWLWPARALYPDLVVPLFGRPILLARILQHTSSLLGLLLVLAYLRWSPARNAHPSPHDDAPPTPGRAQAARRLATLLAAPLLAGALAAFIRLRAGDPMITRALWDAAWSGAAWFLALLAAVCLLARRRRRAPRP